MGLMGRPKTRGRALQLAAAGMAATCFQMLPSMSVGKCLVGDPGARPDVGTRGTTACILHIELHASHRAIWAWDQTPAAADTAEAHQVPGCLCRLDRQQSRRR